MPVDAGGSRRGGENYGNVYRENSRLPGLPAAFAALDRVMSMKARLRALNCAGGRGHQKCTTLGSRPVLSGAQRSALEQGRKKPAAIRRFPRPISKPLPRDEARAELSASQIAAGRAQQAFQTAQVGRGFRNSFVRGQAQAASGRYKEAAASFLQASGATELEVAALENSAIAPCSRASRKQKTKRCVEYQASQLRANRRKDSLFRGHAPGGHTIARRPGFASQDRRWRVRL